MFFCVSGFIIPYSMTKYKKYTIKSFIISRLFRLYPLYWMSLILTLVVFLVFKLNFAVTEINFCTVAANITMFQQFLLTDDILGVYWTLQIELAFYILCAFFCHFKLLNNNKHITITILFSMFTALVFALARYPAAVHSGSRIFVMPE